jgi:hypothetical protein
MNVEHTGLAPGPSLIEGMGMFATRAFRAGERIWRVDDARTADPEMIARVERRETDVRLGCPHRTVGSTTAAIRTRTTAGPRTGFATRWPGGGSPPAMFPARLAETRARLG